jgi:hypothetical protein
VPGSPGRRDGDGGQAPGLVGHAADDPARVGREVAHRGDGPDLGQPGVAAQHGGVAAPVGLARGQHGAPRALHRVVEGQVLALARGLGELDVVDDLAGARGLQAVDRAGVQRARERPLHAEVRERRVVDRDHEQLVGRGGAAHAEAEVDRVVLEPGEDPTEACAHAGRGDDDAGGEHRRRPAPSTGRAQAPHPWTDLRSRAR